MTKPIEMRHCPECQAEFVSRYGSRFCCKEHQRAWNNRQTSEGKALVALVKAAQMGKGGGHTKPDPIGTAAMREMWQLARALNAADAKANRMSALDYAGILMGDKSLWFDRVRR